MLAMLAICLLCLLHVQLTTRLNCRCKTLEVILRSELTMLAMLAMLAMLIAASGAMTR